MNKFILKVTHKYNGVGTMIVNTPDIVEAIYAYKKRADRYFGTSKGNGVSDIIKVELLNLTFGEEDV